VGVIAWAAAVALALAGAGAGAGAGAEAERWVDPRDHGARGDGVSDDTEAFRRAAATGRPMRVARPARHYVLTGPVRLRASVVGVGRPELRMAGADGRRGSHMLEVWGHRGPPLAIRGLRLHGGWDGKAKPAGGEWSHLVLVRGSRGVTIEDLDLERPAGDAILIGGEGHPDPSEDVVIRNNRMSSPLRCAVAAISARGLRIEGNVIRKDFLYVSAIDLEPNPKDREAVEDVTIAGNTFDVPRGVAILLYSWAENPRVNRGVSIARNVARARQFVLKPDGTGGWEGIAVVGNTFHGDPQGGGGRVSLVEIVQDPAHAPRVVSGVTVEGNVIDHAVRRGQLYQDRLDGVRGLAVRRNRWLGDARYELTVDRAEGATVERPPLRR
jgi:hypothetical protein